MRLIIFVACLVVLALQAAPASAQPVTMQNPRAYSETLAETMGVSGVAPLRSLYETLTSGAISANTEAALITYERGLPSTRAIIAQVSEDVTLPNTFRSIYLYHYYGENYWIHTRLDFVRIGDGEWALAYLGFGSDWNGMALHATPSFRPSPRN